MICRACQRGNHPHDRYTNDGGDAGCPNLAAMKPDGSWDMSSACDCRVRLPAKPNTAIHCRSCTCGAP